LIDIEMLQNAGFTIEIMPSIFWVLFYLSQHFQKQFKQKFLKIKAKYNIIVFMMRHLFHYRY
jgi:hypothetical protein